MSQLDRAGRFKAQPTDWGVKEVNDRPMFEVTYKILAFFDNGEWIDWTDFEEVNITGAYWLFKTDNSVNKFCQDSLKECFGWDGLSLESLHSGDWSQVVVQIVCDYEVWKNQQHLKVKFTNPGDSEPQSKVAPEKLKKLDTTWGARLKAAGGSAPKPPARPSSSPTAPPRRQPPRQIVPPGLQQKSNGHATREEAWAAVSQEFDFLEEQGRKKASPELREQEWHEIIGKLFPNRDEDSLTPAEWGTVKEQGPKKIVPF